MSQSRTPPTDRIHPQSEALGSPHPRWPGRWRPEPVHISGEDLRRRLEAAPEEDVDPEAAAELDAALWRSQARHLS